MQSINVEECKDCGSIGETLSALDRRIAEVGGNMYASLTTLSKKFFTKRYLKDLIYFRNILSNIYWNTEYYENYNYQEIVSKIKSII